MADDNLSSVYDALRAADAAGNTEDATRLAQYITSLTATMPPQAPTAPQGGGPLPGDAAYAPIPPDPNHPPGPATDPGANEPLYQSIPENLGKGAGAFFTNVGEMADTLMGIHDPKTRAALYNKWMNQFAPPVPSGGDIKNGHDFADYAAYKLGGMLPYVVGAAGGVAPLVALGAAEGGGAAAGAPNATPASITAGAGLGSLESAIVPPFLGGSFAEKLLGFGLMGGANAATGHIPEAVATGNPADALPSLPEVAEGFATGALGGGAFAAGHAALGTVAGAGSADVSGPRGPDADARARLAQRIKFNADQNGLDLNQIKYDAKGGAKDALDQTHNGLRDDINGLWGDIRDTLPEPQDMSDRLQLARLNSIITSATNKLKGRVGTDDLNTLQRTVGGSEEGAMLVDLVRQSNELTDLFKGGLKGGLSRYTDILNPFARGGAENSFQSSAISKLPLGGLKLFELGALYAHPGAAVPMLAGYGLGRGVDAFTGRRSRVATFVRQNDVTPNPIDFSGTNRSIITDNFQRRSDSAASQKAFDDYMAGKRADAAASQQAFDAYSAGRRADATAAQRSYDSLMAAPQRAYDQYIAERNADAKASQTAFDAYTRARTDARERALNLQKLQDNSPGVGGFYKSIYDQTGLLPQDAARGVFELNRTGRITPDERDSFFKSPRDLMAGNAGNHVIDMLDMMARNGQLQRDPAWVQQREQQPLARPQSPQSGTVYNPDAYAAQAAGNQSRLTEAQSRVAATDHPAETKQLINDAIASIGRTNNRQDATEIANNAVQALGSHSPEAQAYARQEFEPLVRQIRHPTPEAAAEAGGQASGQPLIVQALKRDSRGRPIQRQPLNLAATDRIQGAMQEAMPRGGLTQDVTREGNPVTRLWAQLYKAKAGIEKPAYDSGREPDEAFLKAVADYHDKAVHDPDNPAVARSYAALARETMAQFKSLGRDLKVETWKGQGEPYRNSREMMRDVADNRHLWFLPTDSAFGQGDEITHPMLADTGLKTADGHPLLVNDVFRIVHDLFGHTQHGFQFGPKGEYNAFREHAQMYSDEAVPALAAETLAQNAWVNYGPHLRRLNGSLPKQGDADYVPPAKRRFSDQKAYAFPPELIARDPNVRAEKVVDNPKLLGPEFTAILDQEKARHSDDSDALAAALDQFLQRIPHDQPQSPSRESPQSGVGPSAGRSLAKYLDITAKNTGRAADIAPNGADFPSVPLNPGELVVYNHNNLDEANKMAQTMTGPGRRPVRVVPFGDQPGGAVVLGPKPKVDYPTAEVPEPTPYTDPEGRQGAASFIAGIERPDGTTKGLTTPQIRAVAKSIARLVEGGTPAPGQNGVYDAGNNTIRVYDQPVEQHERVLGHETGHAIEKLAGVAERLGLRNDKDKILPELQALSRLERPHLWEEHSELVKSFGPSARAIPEYRNRLDELFADAFRHYMTAPAETKKVAPVAARFMRSIVNPSNIGKVIAFTSIGGLALPGIIAQALSSFQSGGDQEDA